MIHKYKLIPSRPASEIMIGRVVDIYGPKIRISLAPSVLIYIVAEGYTVGDRLWIAVPGGILANAQIIGRASDREADGVGHWFL